jgi:hypothetical protein
VTINRLAGLVVALMLAQLMGFGTGMAYASQTCVSPKGVGGCFSSIQAAVDAAAPGTTILINAGTYAEQVTIIGKDLTLSGQKGTIIRAPAGMAQTLLPEETRRAIIGVKNANVTLLALTINGARSAKANPGLVGILYAQAGGEIRKNTVKDVGFGPRPVRAYEGEGIVVVNRSATPRTITIAENRVAGFNSLGIVVGGFASIDNPTFGFLTAHVVKNTVVGAGTTNAIEQYGIQYGLYTIEHHITGTLSENQVSNVRYTGRSGFPAVAIAVVGAYDVPVQKNVVANAQRGIDLQYLSSGIQVVKNIIRGPASQATGYQGIGVAGNRSRVAENSLTNLEVGIKLYNDQYIGFAENAMMVKNHFQHVAQAVVKERGASAIRAE